MAAGAQFTVAGQGTGQRTVPARDFFLGYRKVDLAPHEVLVKVRNDEAFYVWCASLSCGIGALFLGYRKVDLAPHEVLVKARRGSFAWLHNLTCVWLLFGHKAGSGVDPPSGQVARLGACVPAGCADRT